MFSSNDAFDARLDAIQANSADGQPSKIFLWILLLFFIFLWWFKGVMLGVVTAFFVYLVTPEGPERGWPALYSFIGVTFVVGFGGTVVAWRAFRAKLAAMGD